MERGGLLCSYYSSSSFERSRPGLLQPVTSNIDMVVSWIWELTFMQGNHIYKSRLMYSLLTTMVFGNYKENCAL